jgi:two-component system nitrogen regulation response regulator GlnG/two-component system response regulator HydG
VPGLAVLWSAVEPERVGEVALVFGGEQYSFGRAPDAFHPHPLVPEQPRPGDAALRALCSPGISRVQWLVRRAGQGLEIENVGRAALIHNGRTATRVTAAIGDVVEITGELALLVVARPAWLPSIALPAALTPRFGAPDALGIVGESFAAWELRRQLAFAARRDDHVLLVGPSGSGKELAAGALHQLSRRAVRPMVARSAATFPDSLIDAELFGNARDYPNPGMAERPGLLGAADGSTLFLDEIGELPHALQAHLLRVLDAGEYQRLGEARSRRSSARLIAATNRAPHELKHDLLARLRLRIVLPGLDQRREDIPLIARHLLRTMAAGDPELARFFHNGDPSGEPRWTARFVTALVTARLTGNVRELTVMLCRAMMDAGDTVLDVIPDPVPDAALDGVAAATPALRPVEPRTLDANHVRAALHACDGVQERAWRALGLRSRYQLIRLMRKLGITARPTPNAVDADDTTRPR